ncbi:hypothetical protein ACJX0J_026845 [Zea mays]
METDFFAGFLHLRLHVSLMMRISQCFLTSSFLILEAVVYLGLFLVFHLSSLKFVNFKTTFSVKEALWIWDLFWYIKCCANSLQRRGIMHKYCLHKRLETYISVLLLLGPSALATSEKKMINPLDRDLFWYSTQSTRTENEMDGFSLASVSPLIWKEKHNQTILGLWLIFFWNKKQILIP